MKKVKVIEHGYFFKNGYLKTKCTCGCVYITSNKMVKHDSEVRVKGERHWEMQEYFLTECPECHKYNKQFEEDLRKEMEAGQ